MSVKVAKAGVKTKWEKKKTLQIKALAIRNTLAFVLGFLFSLAGFNKDFSPFGVAFCASAPKELTIASALGAAVGWFFALDSVSALRYTAAVLALVVMMNAIKPFGQIRENPVTASACVFVCLFVTGIAIVFAEEVNILSVLICFAEGVVGAVASHLFTKSRTVLELKGGIMMLTSKEATALVVCAMLLLLSVRSIEFFSVSPANIITSLLVLICGYYCREAGGAVVGVCGGLAMSVGSGNMLLLSFYSFGGLLSGVFSSYGRVAAFLAYMFAGVAVAAMNYNEPTALKLLIETTVSGALFFALSLRYNSTLTAVLKPSVNIPIIENVKRDVFKRLKKASRATEGICTSLTSVNEALSKSEKSDISNVAKKSKERVCGSCGLYDVCWGENFEETQDAFNTLLAMKKEGKYLEYKTVPQQFAARCIRTENVSSSFNKLYDEYKIRQKTEYRLREIHTLAAEQFVNVSALLDSLCSKIDEDVRFDMDTSARAKMAATACGFKVCECCCIIDAYDKMLLEIKVKAPKDKLDLSALSTQLELITGRGLELPLVEREDELTSFLYKEKSDYKVISSGVQFCAKGEKYSGDTFSTFEDDNGVFYAVICDGMGTGTRAALASSLAVALLEKLIKAGFGIKASVNTVNTALISKSGDECSVTLDLVAIDLFTGHTEFYKSGAADTIVKKSSRITQVSLSSLPLGIISNTEISCGTGALSKGDIIVMTSDGVGEDDKAFIKKELKSFSSGNVRGFTTDLSEGIRKNQAENTDDITVLTLVLTNNE